jgi:hypothetical protein
MGDDRIGVSEAGSDILGLELRVVFAQGVFGHTLGEQSQYQLDGDPHIPNEGSGVNADPLFAAAEYTPLELDDYLGAG